jgi:DNA-binding HxlR family transcriptional regulator
MGELKENLSDSCSLGAVLDVIGERWCFMILRASFNGVRHFEDFLLQIGIARNILANRLTRMVEGGIMARTPCADDKRKIEYRLTEKGSDLLPTMLAMRQWGEKWETGIASNPVLADNRDRRPIGKISIRSHDDRVLTMDDLCWIDQSELASTIEEQREDQVVRHLRDIGLAVSR